MTEKEIKCTLTPAKMFDLYLTGRGISSTWVAKNLDVSLSLICNIRSGYCALTEKMRQKLNELLDTDY